MIVLHAGLHEKHLVLWGEMPPASPSVPRRGRRSKAAGVPPSPLDARVEGLADALTKTGWSGWISLDDAEVIVVWMPITHNIRKLW